MSHAASHCCVGMAQLIKSSPHEICPGVVDRRWCRRQLWNAEPCGLFSQLSSVNEQSQQEGGTHTQEQVSACLMQLLYVYPSIFINVYASDRCLSKSVWVWLHRWTALIDATICREKFHTRSRLACNPSFLHAHAHAHAHAHTHTHTHMHSNSLTQDGKYNLELTDCLWQKDQGLYR